ncbi:hypothetical protein PoB_000038100 [Plakobranchus ocellatus]|uniref:C-type lectin domain-containing protein n=1 Tax=Plakobranchus ocellatus TaxID=259542 RepID=A0AAV3XS50_9GAST|nr:hypothetical protein PoB_000038100 [Plakobranchus ocellatus]
MARMRQCCFLIVRTIFFTTLFLKIQASGRCGQWLEIPRSKTCLKFFRWPEKTWHDARLACKNMGADLVTIRNKIKAKLVEGERSNR